jgi:hypothetical protein
MIEEERARGKSMAEYVAVKPGAYVEDLIHPTRMKIHHFVAEQIRIQKVE